MEKVEHTEDVKFGRYEGCKEPQYRGFAIQSLYLTMRDGVRIAIDLVMPKNVPSSLRIPTLMLQTRYWRNVEARLPFKWFQKPDEFLQFFTSYGYAIVLVDVRGTGASFGTQPHPWAKNEITDSGEIANWIVNQPWSNGKIGTIGVSYTGATAELTAANNHPAVKAIIPRFSQFDVFTDLAFPGGVFHEWLVKYWSYNNRASDENNTKERFANLLRLLKEAEKSFVGTELPKAFRLLPRARDLEMGRWLVKGVKPVDSDKRHYLLKQAVRAHANNGDLYKLAQGYSFRDDKRAFGDEEFTIDGFSVHSFKEAIERSKVAIYAWGSWFDAGTADGVIRRFLTLSNPLRAVIGPWSHGAEYHASPYLPIGTPVDPSINAQWLECLRFLDYHLKDVDIGVMSEKVLIYYTSGEEKWKMTSVWPPAQSTTQRWYMVADNSLSKNPPKSKSGVDTYTVDFEATTGKTNRWHTQFGGFAVIYPNRAEEDRRLLTYTSPPLPEDTEITGYPVITLYVTSTATDGAFFVYLEDVDEAGKVTYVTEGQLRAIHRKISTDPPPYNMLVPYHSFKRKDAMPLMPGEVVELTFGLLPTSVLIKKGHQIRTAIAGHDKGTFARIPTEGTPVITVARNKLHASFIDLPVARTTAA